MFIYYFVIFFIYLLFIIIYFVFKIYLFIYLYIYSYLPFSFFLNRSLSIYLFIHIYFIFTFLFSVCELFVYLSVQYSEAFILSRTWLRSSDVFVSCRRFFMHHECRLEHIPPVLDAIHSWVCFQSGSWCVWDERESCQILINDSVRAQSLCVFGSAQCWRFPLLRALNPTYCTVRLEDQQ